jgi:hypothetical protein
MVRWTVPPETASNAAASSASYFVPVMTVWPERTDFDPCSSACSVGRPDVSWRSRTGAPFAAFSQQAPGRRTC